MRSGLYLGILKQCIIFALHRVKAKNKQVTLACIFAGGKTFFPLCLSFHWENIPPKKLVIGITLHRNKVLLSHENTSLLVSENTFTHPQIWCWLTTQDSWFFFIFGKWGIPSCELLKVVTLYPASSVGGDLALYFAGSKNPQFSLTVKIWVLFVKVMLDWIIVIIGSFKIPNLIYLQNIYIITFFNRKQKISPSFLTFMLPGQVKLKIY